MNTYRYQFFCLCPKNEQKIRYSLEIQSLETIMVEDIIARCSMYQLDYHERIAAGLAKEWPNTRQIIRAHHHGVDIETIRGGA